MPVKKVTIRLPDDLWRRVRILGIQRGESLQKMIERFLREVVRRPQYRRAGTKQRRRFR